MSHWTMIKTKNALRQRRRRDDNSHVPSSEADQQVRLEGLERLINATVRHLTTEPIEFLRWLADAHRGTMLGDAAAQALERKGLLPHEFCETPVRRIRRDV